MAKRTIYPLFVAEDEQKIQPILDALQEKGFSICRTKTPKPDDVVLFFLSAHLSETSSVVDEFLRCDAKKMDIIPINLDGSTPPALIENAILARNMISASRYSSAELMERIADALKKPGIVLPLIWRWIIVAAVVILFAVVGIVLFRRCGGANKPEPAAEATSAPTSVATAEPAISIVPGNIPPEDIDKIVEIVFVGDTYRWYTSDDRSYIDGRFSRGYDAFSYRYWTDEGARWISKEDGHEFPLTHYDDLSWLSELPNLKYVTFCAVDAVIPSLANQKKLTGIFYCDNNIGTLEWLRGSSLHFIEYHGSDVKDFSPLTDCPNFNSGHIDLVFSTEVDFSGFYPPKLSQLDLGNGYHLQTVDLSGLDRCSELTTAKINNMPVAENFSLNGCQKLSQLEIVGLPVHSLSFLSGCMSLEELHLENLSIGTLSGIENLKKLKTLHMENVSLWDISAVSGCLALQTFYMGGSFNENLRDLSALCSLPKLREISTHSANISNLDFLNNLRNKRGISLHLSSSSITDFSGLAAIQQFTFAHMNLADRDFSTLVLPYIQNASFTDLCLFRCDNVDLSTLPRVSNSISIDYGTMTSLEGLNQEIRSLELKNCQYLTSLEGIQNLKYFKTGNGELFIEGCPRLVDWSALNGLRLYRMEFSGTFTLPDFSKTNARFLKFNWVDESALSDLSVLNGLDKTKEYDFDFSCQQNLTDLIPLFRLHGGHLVIPPQLEEQAAELVENRQFKSYEVSYPDGDWQPDSSEIVLLSLDELETLPKSVLAKVDRFSMAGDILYDSSQYRLEQDWNFDPPVLYLCKNDSGEENRIPVEYGTQLTDLSLLKNLTGLRTLELSMQPLTSLEGIQYLESLENLNVEFCTTLTDASAAFTLQTLRWVNLRYSSVTSADGVQNLYSLEQLDLEGTKIQDYSPLASLSEQIRLNYCLSLMTYEEFCALPAVILNNVDKVMIAGDYAFDPWADYAFETEWDMDTKYYYIRDNRTGTRTQIGMGTMTDLSSLPVMQRLERLWICVEPISSVAGAEQQPNLRVFELQDCFEIRDISLLFDMEELNQIALINTGIRSIEGIQKLKKLTWLTIQNCEITDISPIGEIDYTFCEQPNEWGEIPHFHLEIERMADVLPKEAYEVLSAVPNYDYLDIDGTDYRLWTDLVKNIPIRVMQVCDCQWDNNGFRTFIEQHPEIEKIDVCWDRGLTDLTPLLSLNHLQFVTISEEMQAAARSLGSNYGFQLFTGYQ